MLLSVVDMNTVKSPARSSELCPQGFYVYAHIQPDSRLPRYIGKGIYGRAWSFGTPRSLEHTNWVRNILNTTNYSYFDIVVILLKDLFEQEALDAEAHLITVLQRNLGWQLFNACDGRFKPRHRCDSTCERLMLNGTINSMYQLVKTATYQATITNQHCIENSPAFLRGLA